MHLFRNQLRQCECTESLPLGMPFEFKFDILSSITNQINKQYVDVSATSNFLLKNWKIQTCPNLAFSSEAPSRPQVI